MPVGGTRDSPKGCCRGSGALPCIWVRLLGACRGCKYGMPLDPPATMNTAACTVVLRRRSSADRIMTTWRARMPMIHVSCADREAGLGSVPLQESGSKWPGGEGRGSRLQSDLGSTTHPPVDCVYKAFDDVQ